MWIFFCNFARCFVWLRVCVPHGHAKIKMNKGKMPNKNHMKNFRETRMHLRSVLQGVVMALLMTASVQVFADEEKKPPYTPYFTDISFDTQTKKLRFTDTYKPDETLDRYYTVKFYYWVTGTYIFVGVGVYDTPFYSYGATSGSHYLETKIKDPETEEWITQDFTVPHNPGGERVLDISESVSACLKAGEGNLFIAIEGYEKAEGKKVPFEAEQEGKLWEGCYLNNNIKVSLHCTVQLALEVIPDQVEYGNEYRFRLTYQGSDRVYYRLEHQREGEDMWYSSEAGEISTREAREGTTLNFYRTFDQNNQVGTERYRVRLYDSATQTEDTTEEVTVSFNYPWIDMDGKRVNYYKPGAKLEYPKLEDDCMEYVVKSEILTWGKEEGDMVVFYQPRCPAELVVQPKQYTVKFYNADYTLLKTEKVDCGSDATPPDEPTMEGMVFKQWSRDYTNVQKDFSVIAQYEMGDDYFFYDIMASHTNDRYKAYGFEGSSKRAMIGDTLTFTAEIRTPSESTLRYQQGLRDKDGNWTWGEPKTIGQFTAADAEKGESKTFTLKVAAAYEYYNEIAWRYGEAYRFNLYSAGDVLLSEPYEFDIYYPLTVKSQILDGIVYEALMAENESGDFIFDDPCVVPARYNEKVYIYRSNGGSGACMKFARVNRPSMPVDSGEDEEENVYIIAPGEAEQVDVTVEKKLIVFDGVYGEGYPKQLDFTAEGFGKLNGYYAEVVNCGGGISHMPAEPTAEGYVFAGWEPWDASSYDSLSLSNVPAIPEKILGFTAVFEEVSLVPTFTVRFNEKDGVTQIGASQKVEEGMNAVPPVPPLVEGWHFVGWDKSYAFVMEDMDLTAVYGDDSKTWTVTYYDTDGVSKIGDESVLDGMNAQILGASKEGHIFLGWVDENGDPAVFTRIFSDLSVFAQWEAIQYTVVFQDQNGNELKTEQVAYGQAATPPDMPEIEGYDFLGWGNDINHVTKDMTVKAVYVIKTFVVIFLDKDGEQLNSQTVEWDGPAIAPEAPEVEGWHFVGWDKEFFNVKEDLVVQAVYDINTYTVTFVGFEDADLGSQTVNWNEAAEAPEAPEVEGYTFKGWDKAFDHVTEDMTITAQYEIKTFTVTFVGFEDADLGSQTVNWNEAAEAPEAPEVEGYTFKGWDKAFDHVTEDMTVTAVYEKKGPGTGVESTQPSAFSIQKVLRDGVIYIERNGKTYDTTGQLIQ